MKFDFVASSWLWAAKQVFCLKHKTMIIKPITTEQLFSCSTTRLWRAITNVKEMRQWFFDNIPDFKAEVGFETHFLVDAGERQFIHVWKILDVKKEKLIKYHWSYKGYEGAGIVTFLIESKNKQTLLKLTNEGLESFRPKVPEFTRENCLQGWQYFINNRLKNYLADS